MQTFVVPVSKTKMTWMFYGCLAINGLVVYELLDYNELNATGRIIFIIVLFIFCLLAVHAYRAMKYTPPEYIISDQGIHACVDDRIISWDDISYFKTVQLGGDNGYHREIECFNSAGKKVLTINLKNTDTSIEWMEQLLEAKLTKQQ